MKKALFLSFFITFLMAPAEAAIQMDLQGCPTRNTPFDHKSALQDVLHAKESCEIRSRKAMEALFWQARKFAYVKEGPRDVWQAPSVTEKRKAGDCEDKALWLYNQLRANGYRNLRIVVGKYRTVDPTYHVWLTQTGEDGSVRILDPTMQSRIWKTGRFGKGLYQPLYSFDGARRWRHARALAGVDCQEDDEPLVQRMGRKLLSFERVSRLQSFAVLFLRWTSFLVFSMAGGPSSDCL